MLTREMVREAQQLIKQNGLHNENWIVKKLSKFNSVEDAQSAFDMAQRPESEWSFTVLTAANQPATSRQIAYINALNVVIPPGRKLTKQAASDIITAVKSGDGVGTFGLFFRDGSN